MPLATTTLIGPILLPSGSSPPSGYLKFVLDTYDTDAGQIVAPAPITVSIAADGSFSVPLWPNARGIRNTHYGVLLGTQNGQGLPTEVSLGLISVPVSAVPVQLEDLLGAPIPPTYTATVVLTQAAYDALVTKSPTTLYLIEG